MINKTEIKKEQDKIKELIDDPKKMLELRDFFANFPNADIAELIEDLDMPIILKIIRSLNTDIAAEVFTYLSPDTQEQIIEQFTANEVKDIFEEMYTDDIIDVLDEMPANIVKKILRNTNKETRNDINFILKYDDQTAGGIMSVDFIKIREDLTIHDAIIKMRGLKNADELFDLIFVVDKFSNLKGKIYLKDLILNNTDATVEEIMDKRIVSTITSTDQEEVASLFKKYDLNVLPVVNNQNKLVGVITVDDIIDVIEEEATEDIHKMAGISPTEDSYFKTSVFKMVRSRSVWLLFLMISATLSQIVISVFVGIYTKNSVDNGNSTINNNTDITYILTVLLTPLLTVISGTSGNAGSQSSTMVIRSMALREVKTKDLAKVLWKELRVAFLCGLILVVVNFVRMTIIYAIQYKGDINRWYLWESIATLSISMFITLIIAKLVGGTLPILAKTIKLDPAVMAAPLLTTLVDALSTAVFFSIGLIFFGGMI
ncbi:magnesium transporter [Spiroplasma endosymbiont of Labia minor]|uniref:magnesium transporter n=1 Tax=Spiroplasma endosymbiont of Labia minor TaxID=3066305 RepID=UPI0030CDF55B